MRLITYCEALNEAMHQEMERDQSIFICGLGVPDHKRVFGTTEGLPEKFGRGRCFDTPLSEAAMTGFVLGAALNGLRPIHIHIRMDFLLLAMNQLANMVSSQRYMSGETLKAPLVIRAIIGRGWGQGHQHSKAMYSIFAHIPGLKVVLPTTPYDAKGMLISAIRSDDPVLFIEHRWLYWQEGDVPEETYEVPLESPHRVRKGNDLTIAAVSWMNVEALKAAEILEARYGISVEIIDVRSLTPFNWRRIALSVMKTKYCIIADNDWIPYGASAEIATRVYDLCYKTLKHPVERIGFAFTPCPTARHLENKFYSNAATIVRKAESMLGLGRCDLSNEDFYSHERKFKGPF